MVGARARIRARQDLNTRQTREEREGEAERDIYLNRNIPEYYFVMGIEDSQQHK